MSAIQQVLVAAVSSHPVDHISQVAGLSSATITLPNIGSGEMIVLFERSNSGTTPPSLRSGYTSIGTSTNGTWTRSTRLSYCLGPRAHENITTGTVSCAVRLAKAGSIGQFALVNATSSASTTVSVPGLSGLTKKSAILYFSYSGNDLVSIGAPFTLGKSGSDINGCVGWVENIQADNITGITATTAAGVYNIGWSVEIKPI